MTVHIVVYVIPILLYILIFGNQRKSKQKNKIYLILSFLPIFFAEALRSERVGTDTIAYTRVFSSMVHSGNWIRVGWEPLYLLYSKGISFISKEPQALIITSAFIICLSIGLFIYKCMDDNESAFWSVLLFLSFLHYANSMNLMRQYLAMSLVIQVYWILRDGNEKKRWIISILLIVLASLIHTAAIISFIIFIPFILKKIDWKILALSGTGIVIFVYAFDKVLPVIFSFLPQYLKYMGTSRGEGEEFGLFYFSFFLLKVLLVFLVLYLNPSNEKNKGLYQLAFLVMVSAGLLAMKTQISLAFRTSYFFDIFTIIYAPKILYRFKYGKILCFTLLFIYAVFFFFHTIGSPERACVPYLFFWQQ